VPPTEKHSQKKRDGAFSSKIPAMVIKTLYCHKLIHYRTEMYLFHMREETVYREKKNGRGLFFWRASKKKCFVVVGYPNKKPVHSAESYLKMASEVKIDYFDLLPIELWKQMVYHREAFSNCKATSKAFHRLLFHQPSISEQRIRVEPDGFTVVSGSDNSHVLLVSEASLTRWRLPARKLPVVPFLVEQMSLLRFVTTFHVVHCVPEKFVYIVMSQIGHRLKKLVFQCADTPRPLEETIQACQEYRAANPNRGLLQNVVECDVCYVVQEYDRSCDSRCQAFLAELSGLKQLTCNSIFACNLAKTPSIKFPSLEVFGISSDRVIYAFGLTTLIPFDPSALPALRSIQITQHSSNADFCVPLLFSKVAAQITHLYLNESRHCLRKWLHEFFPNVTSVGLSSHAAHDVPPNPTPSTPCRAFDLIVPWFFLTKGRRETDPWSRLGN